MPVLKVIKNKKYTVMCNNHLFDKNLSLKSIGLFSIILDLYSIIFDFLKLSLRFEVKEKLSFASLTWKLKGQYFCLLRV